MTDTFNKDRLYAENQDLRERIAELEAQTLNPLPYNWFVDYMESDFQSENDYLTHFGYARMEQEQ